MHSEWPKFQDKIFQKVKKISPFFFVKKIILFFIIKNYLYNDNTPLLP